MKNEIKKDEIKLNMAVLPLIIGKQEMCGHNGINLSAGLVNICCNTEEFPKLVMVHGCAVTSQFTTEQGEFVLNKPVGYRKTENFVRSSLAFVDIDYGLTIDEALNNEFYKLYGFGFYTTASHKTNAHRFRLFFRFETDIDDPDDMRAIATELISARP